MSDENMKVNDFELGIDDVQTVHNETFQQIYGDEANLVYRAESAEEVLDDLPKLEAMIQHHIQHQRPRLAALDAYTKARNEGIYKDSSRRTEKDKADHRAAHNFAKVINIFDVGYNTGIPIKKTSDLENVNEIVNEYDKLNDAPALETELWKDFRKYGRAYELQYRNAKDEDRSVLSSVFETFVVYGLDVERTPLFAVRYPCYRSGIEEKTAVQVYTNTETIYFKPCGLGMIKLVEDYRESHEWGEVPITEYIPDRDRMGGYEDVIPLIDLYDAAQSDTANYMTDLNDALLVISGDLDLAKYKTADLIAMKKANMLLLANGVNPDGSKSQTNAEYIYKQYDVAGAEAYKERVRKDIHSTSLIPDLTDDAFSGTQSGEAMKYKLFGFIQAMRTAQNGFKDGLKRRYRLLLNIKHAVNEADNVDLGNFEIKFTPNLPKAILEELKALVEAGVEFSQETLLGLASFVEDIQAEVDRVNEEKKKSVQDAVMTAMFPAQDNSEIPNNEEVEDGTN